MDNKETERNIKMNDHLEIPEFLKRTPGDVVHIGKAISAQAFFEDAKVTVEPTPLVTGQKKIVSKEHQNNVKAWALASDLQDATFTLTDTKEIIRIIQRTQVNPVVAKITLMKVNELTEELMLIGFDEQVTEAYDYLSKAEQKKLQNKAREVSQVLNQYINNKRNKRKTRTSSKVTKKLENVKYQKEDLLLQVTSLEPSMVVGKRIAVAFDTKSRQLQVFKALNAEGLTIEGTTIKNFDPEQSSTKTIRKPQGVVNSFVRVTEARFAKVYEQINSKEKAITGRTNNTTLFLCVFS